MTGGGASTQIIKKNKSQPKTYFRGVSEQEEESLRLVSRLLLNGRVHGPSDEDTESDDA